MASPPLPKATRAATVVALLVAFTAFISARSGPIMLFGFSFAALLSAVSMLRRRAWGAWGFALLIALSILAVFFFLITGQSAGNFAQIAIFIIIYFGIAVLFFFAGFGLKLQGGKLGSPIPWIVLAVLFSIPFLYFRPMPISSGSMENTLQIGDFVLVDRFSTHPKLGDLVVFHAPYDHSQISVKRVIGIPGDHIHFAGGRLYRNGQEIREPYVTHKFRDLVKDMNQFPNDVNRAQLQPSGLAMLDHDVSGGDVVVPPGKYFVAGDARDNSLDSRYWGFLNQRDILGEPKFIYDSLAPDPADAIKEQDGKIEVKHAPTRRWDRLFKAL